MALRVTGTGEKVVTHLTSRSTLRLQWVSRETDGDGRPLRTRTPEESANNYHLPLPFRAAGKSYLTLGELTAEKEADGICRDRYGRTVVCLTERFPCFDSYDYLTENRYYRWWLIMEPERVTRVYSEDGRNEVYVTEDVSDLEDSCVDALRKYGYIV